jgi:hypothetical protein
MSEHQTSPAKPEDPKAPTRDELLAQCRELAEAPNILDKLTEELRRCGVVGDLKRFHILFLAILTRFSDAPVSVVLKGEATAGKSFTLETILRYYPSCAYEHMSGMSPKAILYWDADLRHRMLCVGEFAGLQSDSGNPWIRQLLTEKRLRYIVTGEDGRGGRKAMEKIIEGPTGLLMTTTSMGLHPEDESRMISVYVDDDPAQTAAILTAQALKAQGIPGMEPDIAPWHALHDWIAAGTRQVVGAFFADLARQVDPSNGRMKRDFPKLLELVKAHALLHQASREVDAEGRVIATLEDYEAVHDLLAMVLAEGQQETLDPGVNEVVAAVSATSLLPVGRSGVSQQIIVQHLEEKGTPVNKSTVSRRTAKALKQGYLVANPTAPGQPQQLKIGTPRGKPSAVLPPPEVLRKPTT